MSKLIEQRIIEKANWATEAWNSYINAVWSCDGMSDHVYHNLLINE